MSKHTPGPWTIGKVYSCHTNIVSADGSPVAKTDCHSDRNFQPFNAHLIAAAPELLEMLKEMLASAHPHPVEHPTMTAAWAKAKAVIAKAEGRA